MQSAVRWRGLLWCAVAVGATACAGGNQAGPTATLSTASPTTTADPYAIPEVIDVAYVNRVLEGLDTALGDIVRIVYASKTIPLEAIDRLRTLYTNDFVQVRIDGFQSDMRRGLASYLPGPGDQKTTVSRVISARLDCIFVEANRDYSAVATDPDPRLSRLWVGLRRPEASLDVSSYNPTKWMYIYDGFQPDLTEPPDPCAS